MRTLDQEAAKLAAFDAAHALDGRAVSLPAGTRLLQIAAMPLDALAPPDLDHLGCAALPLAQACPCCLAALAAVCRAELVALTSARPPLLSEPIRHELKRWARIQLLWYDELRAN